MPVTHDADFEALLGFLKRDRGFDFTGYKRTTLQRRVQKRMETVEVDDYAAYLARLEADPREFASLFDTLLINVTRFFRDGTPWTLLAERVIPALLARLPESVVIRVWSAGCASGEEAYTLAMLFAEAMGMDRFRERVRIYATDADEDALGQARAASYTDEQAGEVPEALRRRYLERADGRWTIRRELRRAVIFGRNDLVQDAPISRIDLLVCRNTLMYFDAATQAEVIGRFHFAMTDGGILFLGRAETLLTQTHAFVPVDLTWRVFSKVSRRNLRERLVRPSPATRLDRESPTMRLRDAALEVSGEAQVVVDRAGVLLVANARARHLFEIARADIGRPLQDLELSYRPAELRGLIDQCYATRALVVQREVRWRGRHAAADTWLDVEVSPVTDGDVLIGATVLLRDVTEALRLRSALELSRDTLETTNEQLLSANLLLDTTNEELQSTVEELETTNEELHSTNEALETMNEELHSTNGELHAVNDALRDRGEELNGVNEFLAAVFASMRGGVVVLDRDARVLVWNAQSEELWGVRGPEVVGTSFFALDIGFPVELLAGRIRAVLAGDDETVMPVMEATNRRGRRVSCRVACAPLRAAGGPVRGAIVTMEVVASGA